MAIEVVKTIKIDGTGDYTSLSAFESGENRDLVSVGEIAVAEIYDNLELNYVDFRNGWTTDDTHRIILRCPTISGEYDSNYYHAGITGNGVTLNGAGTYAIVPHANMTIAGLELTSTVTARPIFDGASVGATIRSFDILANEIVSVCQSYNEVSKNCVFIHTYSSTGLSGTLTYAGKAYNCTVYADGGGSYNGQIIFRNTECYNCAIWSSVTTGYSHFYGCKGNYNACSDGSAPGADSLKNLSLSDFGFKDVVSTDKDLNLNSDSVLIDAGIGYNSDSAVPAIDVAGNDRGADVCDIGAFEFIDIQQETIDFIFNAANTSVLNTTINLQRNNLISIENTGTINTIDNNIVRNSIVDIQNMSVIDSITSLLNRCYAIDVQNMSTVANIISLLNRCYTVDVQNMFVIDSIISLLNRYYTIGIENLVSIEDILISTGNILYFSLSLENGLAVPDTNLYKNINYSIEPTNSNIIDAIVFNVIRCLKIDLLNNTPIDTIVYNVIRNINISLENTEYVLDIPIFIEELLNILKIDGYIRETFTGNIKEIYNGTIN